MYVDILFPLTKAIPIMFENVTTHYLTLQILIDNNTTRYHNLNVLPHVLPHALCTFSVSLAWFGGYFQLETTRYRQIYKKNCILIFVNKKCI